MKEKGNAFKTMEELNQYLTLNVLYQLKLDLVAENIDIRVYEDSVRLIVKTRGCISEMALIVKTCSKWKAYADNGYLVFEFDFILDE